MMLLFKNSVFLAGSITVLNTILSALAAYAFAKIPFPGCDKIFSFMLLTMMIPGVLFLIPTYVLMYRIGWVGHFEALIMPSIVSVFNIFLIRQLMFGIPDEPVVFLPVILPLARPALAVLAIFSIMWRWNDFLWPVVALSKPQNYTLTVGIANMQGEFMTDWGIIFSGAALSALPMIIFFLLFQRYFLEGVRMGAVKG